MAKKIQAAPATEPSITEVKKKRTVTKKVAVGTTASKAAKEVPAEVKTTTPLATKPKKTTKAAAAPKGGVRIFQIYYQRQQLPLLDPAFEPYNNIGDKDPLLEFNVFRKLSQDKSLQSADLWGALSWKFSQKTGLTGAELKSFIDANPGYDVYFCNPHPDTEALYHNLWVQGETCHPNFLVLCREFFQAAGLPVELLTELQPSTLYSSANYFVGTPAFWKSYLQFVGDILAKADKKLSPTTRAILYSSAADRRGMHADASYLPFIVERLFSVFLQSNPAIRALKMPLGDVDGQLNVHLQMLRQMKDVAHAQRSPWMAACWANYRTLYISTMHGKEWVRKYLKAVTPTTIRFADTPAVAVQATLQP